MQYDYTNVAMRSPIWEGYSITWRNTHDLILREKKESEIYVVHDSNIGFFKMRACICIEKTENTQKVTMDLR